MPRQHVVKQGENIVSIAEVYGFFPATIWDHGDNAALKEKRVDMTILMPGDVVVIPDKVQKKVKKPVEQSHKFRRKGVPAIYRLQLFDGEEPRRNQKYSLSVNGKFVDGQLDGLGVLETFLPPSARYGRLVLKNDEGLVDEIIELDFGHLDPVTEVSGVQKRLNNLGFACGEPDGSLNMKTYKALRAFQTRYGLDVTGQIDEATRNKLVELHDDVHEIPPPAAQS